MHLFNFVERCLCCGVIVVLFVYVIWNTVWLFNYLFLLLVKCFKGVNLFQSTDFVVVVFSCFIFCFESGILWSKATCIEFWYWKTNSYLSALCNVLIIVIFSTTILYLIQKQSLKLFHAQHCECTSMQVALVLCMTTYKSRKIFIKRGN